MECPDLNFIYLVIALGEERSVSRAAERLGLTQPAVSHALRKLRLQFKDDLFVRAGKETVPTPVGQRLIDGGRQVLSAVDKEIWHAKAFDPLTTERVFPVSLSDMGMIVILPKLLGALRKEAPHASLKPVQVPARQISGALEEGDIDLAIGYLDRLDGSLHQQSLFVRPLVGIVKGGSTRKRVSMPLDAFIASRHAVSSALSITNQLIEKELKRHGAELNVGVEVPYLLAIPSIVAETDFIAAVPEELAQLFSRMANVDVFTLPIEVPDLRVRQFWHARYQRDAGHQWFRALVERTLK